MDFERCAELHNKLAQIGWEAAGYEEPLPATTWWDVYGNDQKAADIAKRSPTFAKFLKLAIVIPFDYGTRNHREHHLFYLVCGLMSPKGMREPSYINVDGLGLQHDNPRFITIYATTIHNDDLYEGVLYDLHSNDAIYVTDVQERHIAFNGRQLWYPLEDMLSNWHTMIENGQIVAISDEADSPPDIPAGLVNTDHEWTVDYNRHRPWVMLPYSKGLLEMCLTSWEQLVQAIEDRIDLSTTQGAQYGIYDEATLNSAEIPPGFARDFLSQARKPKVEYLAPGMRLVSAGDFIKQPFSQDAKKFSHDRGSSGTDLWPIPLLQASELALPGSPVGSWTPLWQFSKSTYAAGLYFDGYRWGAQPLETVCRLVLPFGIGSKGNMRLTDGSVSGEKIGNKDPPMKFEDRHADLYQPGFNPFGDWQHVSLHSILQSWVSLVEKGEWKVSKQGVAESISKWKDADSRNKWHLYRIELDQTGRTSHFVETEREL
ncbi:hypothetical protein EJ05DRAFT_503498 [Pseudovirgaria hyperparasitica]|uniref:Uncharacterized protein n=1 Tax=Pseudovirgaria hyperparasitica TaxID=470096 RepID=A0A6A6VY61_9PEZI|nr:uncharacterized protein EJ05DRAFT_503498 [Pseudovirgaria hyperparasitica]KAF2755193.1 hypothetical protein EJ05DRAFT_503498 [Pseudovirgaria hyperparasitica]